MDVFFAASPASVPRFGVVVPKHRQRIVDRNRVKRRLREIGRIHVLPLLRTSGAAMDVLVRARPDAYRADYGTLRDELVRRVEDRVCESS